MSEISIDESEAIPETLRERDQWVCWREEGAGRQADEDSG